MIKTPLSTVIGGAGIWTPGCTVIGGQQNLDQLIKSLFSDGTQGIYLNAQNAASVSDLSSIKDLSGRNNHATQANATSRATLITDPSGYKSLKFDGIDDGYVTPSINFTNTDKVTVIAAFINTVPLASYKLLLELSVNSDITNGTFGIFAPALAADMGFSVSSRGTSQVKNNIINQPVTSGLILSCSLSISPPSNVNRVNGVQVATSTASQGTGNYTNNPVYIGRRAGSNNPFSGQIYALLVIGKLLDATTTAKIEKEFAKYIGVTL